MTESPQIPKLPPDQKQLSKALEVWDGSSVLVEQGRHWSSAFIWLSTGLFSAVVIWSLTARLDQTITVRGRLTPASSVKSIESPSNGIVRRVFVKDGDLVTLGEPLVTVEALGLDSRKKAIQQNISLLSLQADALNIIIASGGEPRRLRPQPPVPSVNDASFLDKLVTARNQTQQIRTQLIQLSSRLRSRQTSLNLQKRIASDLEPLYRSGGFARNTYLTQLNEVQIISADVASLRSEIGRVIGSAAAQLSDVNRQQINLKAELDGINEAIQNRTVRAPISGLVFDTKVSPFSVVNSSQVLLKIVPENQLQAKVEISNSDIGFVRVGMPVSVSVDSFPSGEFGYIYGRLLSVGSDALPPDQENTQYRFPAVISLQQQSVQSGKQKLNLQSGMSVTANIKLRSRPAITIVTDIFTRQLEGVKRFR